MNNCQVAFMLKAPVVIVGYSRKQTLKKSLRRLSLCEDVQGRDIYLFLDAPRCAEDVGVCSEMLAVAARFRQAALPNLQIVRREKNYGVPGNLLDAIGWTLERYGRMVFFEDDVLVSRTFLSFMDRALEKYQDDPRIFCINGHRYPDLKIPRSYSADVYLNLRNMAWGFGIWKDRWERVDFKMSSWNAFKKDASRMEALERAGCDLAKMIEDQLAGRIHTWDVQCSYHMVERGLWAVEPRFSLTKNIGFEENSGVHCTGRNPILSKQKYYDFKATLPDRLISDEGIVSQFRYSLYDPHFLAKVLKRIRERLMFVVASHDEPIDANGSSCLARFLSGQM